MTELIKLITLIISMILLSSYHLLVDAKDLSTMTTYNAVDRNNNSANALTISLMKNTIGNTEDNLIKNRLSMLKIRGRRFIELWNWIRLKSQSNDNIIGRCFGVAKKLKIFLPLIIFKLGIILTILIFLSIFSLKSLGIGVLLLILNAGGLLGKLALLKSHGAHEKSDHPHSAPSYIPIPIQSAMAQPQQVHFHIHKDSSSSSSSSSGKHHHANYHETRTRDSKPYTYYTPYHSGGASSLYESHESPPTAWADRVSSGLAESKTTEEKLELLELYRRLGFDIQRHLKEFM